MAESRIGREAAAAPGRGRRAPGEIANLHEKPWRGDSAQAAQCCPPGLLIY